MSAERPNFLPQQPTEQPLVLPESFLEALKRERPDNLNWDRIDEAVAVLKKPPEPEPTESQKFWRRMFDTENSPYSEYRPPKANAAKQAWYEFTHDLPAFVRNFPKHIMAIDVDIRGGRNPGDMKERAQRVATMLGVFVVFTAFDAATSRPVHALQKKWFPKRGDDPTTKWNAGVDFGLKFVEVLNDKLATALGDVFVQKTTGKKRAFFTTEPTDKLADVGNVAFEDWVKDLINGPNLEAVARVIYQFPIFGAVVEQFVSGIARLQGRDSISKAVGKAMFMAWAKYWYARRGLSNKWSPNNQMDRYDEGFVG